VTRAADDPRSARCLGAVVIFYVLHQRPKEPVADAGTGSRWDQQAGVLRDHGGPGRLLRSVGVDDRPTGGHDPASPRSSTALTDQPPAWNAWWPIVVGDLRDVARGRRIKRVRESQVSGLAKPVIVTRRDPTSWAWPLRIGAGAPVNNGQPRSAWAAARIRAQDSAKAGSAARRARTPVGQRLLDGDPVVRRGVTWCGLGAGQNHYGN